MSPRGLAASVVLVSLSACHPVGEPIPQWLVTIATDAPVPPLGDRLMIELTDDEGTVCNGCRQLVDVGEPSAWPVTFGILPSGLSISRWRLRVRLFRSSLPTDEGFPASEALIDAAGWLPAPSDVALVLRTDCFGVTDDDPDTTCDPATGTLDHLPILGASARPLPTPGSWPPAKEQPCTDPPDGMVCLPGGVFLLGEPPGIPPLENAAEAAPERLVRLGPFALDRDEVTVAEALEHLPHLPGAVGITPPGKAPRFNCTLHPEGLGDDLPLNCLDRSQASALCEALGKRLPSEAEWEYAAARRQRETSYPWGEDDDVCERAVVARGNAAIGEDASCLGLDLGLEAGLAPGGDPDDVTDLGARNLAGNVSEWVRDDYVPFDDERCWPSGQLLVDPICDIDEGQGVARGGDWTLSRISARSTTRLIVHQDAKRIGVGVRCAVSR